MGFNYTLKFNENVTVREIQMRLSEAYAIYGISPLCIYIPKGVGKRLRDEFTGDIYSDRLSGINPTKLVYNHTGTNIDIKEVNNE